MYVYVGQFAGGGGDVCKTLQHGKTEGQLPPSDHLLTGEGFWPSPAALDASLMVYDETFLPFITGRKDKHCPAL